MQHLTTNQLVPSLKHSSATAMLCSTLFASCIIKYILPSIAVAPRLSEHRDCRRALFSFMYPYPFGILVRGNSKSSVCVFNA